jgi:hypothetical protein
VLPEYVEDRDTQPHGGRNAAQSDQLAAAWRDLGIAERKLAAIRAMAEEYALLDPSQVLEVLDEE